MKTGHRVGRTVVAFEAGRDGFWLARWLQTHDTEAYVIHPTSVAVSREHRRAKTDRLDTELLKRAFLGWLRGEPDHCKMSAVPTIEEEDAKRPNRERESLVGERTRIVNRIKGCLTRLGIRTFKPTLRNAHELLTSLRSPEGVPLPPNTLAEMHRDLARLRFVREQIREIEAARLKRLEAAPEARSNVMVRLLARVIGVGIETADMLVHEVLSRNLRDRRAVARYAGLTGSPDESGSRRREKGLVGQVMLGAAGDHPAGLALSHVSKGQRARAVVPGTDHRRASGNAQIDDRGLGAETACRIMAPRDNRQPTARCQDAPNLNGREEGGFGARRRSCQWLPMTIRGGGYPRAPMALEPLCRMGLPPRSFAADAHYCIMV